MSLLSAVQSEGVEGGDVPRRLLPEQCWRSLRECVMPSYRHQSSMRWERFGIVQGVVTAYRVIATVSHILYLSERYGLGR